MINSSRCTFWYPICLTTPYPYLLYNHISVFITPPVHFKANYILEKKTAQLFLLQFVNFSIDKTIHIPEVDFLQFERILCLLPNILMICSSSTLRRLPSAFVFGWHFVVSWGPASERNLLNFIASRTEIENIFRYPLILKNQSISKWVLACFTRKLFYETSYCFIYKILLVSKHISYANSLALILCVPSNPLLH